MHYELRVSWKTKNKQSTLINIMMPMIYDDKEVTIQKYYTI